jgi:hypothetical protein
MKMKRFKVTRSTESADFVKLRLNRMMLYRSFSELLKDMGFQHGDVLETCTRWLAHSTRLNHNPSSRYYQTDSGAKYALICQRSLKRTFGRVPRTLYIRKAATK